jgi:uncharacterized protein (TIGR02996 family)
MTALATDFDALLRAVCERPDDDAPRLVLADWYEERGEGARAEFIRCQVELARKEVQECDCDKNVGTHCMAVAALRRRERELWGYLPVKTGVRQQLCDELPGWAVLLGSDKGDGLTNDYPWAIVRRGFVAEVRCTLATLIGGPCGTCDARGYVNEDDRHWIRPTDWTTICPECKGEMRVGGLVAELGRLPLEKVRITDREPVIEYETPIGWVRDDNHAHDISRLRADLIPADLYDCLADGSDQYDSVTWKRYPSAAAAHAALSAATIKLIRQRAGLPELPT